MSMSEPAVPGQGVTAPADATDDAGCDTASSPSAVLNQQFSTLNALRRARTWVDVYLVTGTCLHGQIRSFDSNMLLLQTRTGDVALYHHAISSVMRAQKRAGSSSSKSASGRKPISVRGGSPRSSAPRQFPGGEGAQLPRVWRDQAEGPRSRVEGLQAPVERAERPGIERTAEGRLTASRLPPARRPVTPPAGVVVVRHKRVRTIVKPEDES